MSGVCRTDEITVSSDAGNLYGVLDFIMGHLDGHEVSGRSVAQLELAVEEVFANISKYAYHPGKGEVSVACELDEGMRLRIRFMDRGVPFDPLRRPDPDTTMPMEDRPIGGLGIFLVKRNVDSIEYSRTDGRNVLTIEKVM